MERAEYVCYINCPLWVCEGTANLLWWVVPGRCGVGILV